ncbi:MAG: MBL fold metallo-hydrolase [Bacillota bacterium]|nr:MBL fold metallo-hydrolase [Bacillota bacterium]
MIEIKFCSLASGSSGNCQYIESDHGKILIDAGLSGKAIINLLKSIGVRPEDLDAIFVTHEHRDHIHGVGILSRKLDLPIYANGQTWQAMKDSLGKLEMKNVKEFSIDQPFYFKDIFIRPVPTFHDAANPNGYTLADEKSKISLITDTGWVGQEIIDAIKDSDLYFLESNHDVDMLKAGPYSWPLKQRVLSTRGHLSNDNCSQVAREILKGQGEALVLSHLSIENNTRDLAFNNMKKTIEEKNLIIDPGVVDLEIAPRSQASKFYNLKGDK